MIVLFEKRATDGMQFDYAESLVENTKNLIVEVQSIPGAATVSGDLGAYASLLIKMDVTQCLLIAIRGIYLHRGSIFYFRYIIEVMQTEYEPSNLYHHNH